MYFSSAFVLVAIWDSCRFYAVLFLLKAWPVFTKDRICVGVPCSAHKHCYLNEWCLEADVTVLLRNGQNNIGER